MTWGAQAIVAFPQWEGMEVPIQNAIDSGITVVNFDIVIDADGVYRVTGDNEGMGGVRQVHRREDRHHRHRRGASGSDQRQRFRAAHEGLQ